jgi:hypothetical protein
MFVDASTVVRSSSIVQVSLCLFSFVRYTCTRLNTDCTAKNGWTIVNTVAYFLEARIVELAETAIARERSVTFT